MESNVIQLGQDNRLTRELMLKILDSVKVTYDTADDTILRHPSEIKYEIWLKLETVLS